jgi:hypothetical protein
MSRQCCKLRPLNVGFAAFLAAISAPQPSASVSLGMEAQDFVSKIKRREKSDPALIAKNRCALR